MLVDFLQTLYAICDIAILITKDIAQQKKKLVEKYPGVIPLPASVYKVAEPKAPEVKAPAATNGEPKAAEVKASPPKEPLEPKASEAKADEPNESKTSETNESKTPEANDHKTAKTNEPVESEPNENEAAEPDVSKSLESDEPVASKADETKARESDTPTAPESDKSVDANADESKGTEPNVTAFKGPESGDAAVAVGGHENTEEKKPVEEPAKVDGSHLPPCFTDKDVLAKFKIGTSTKSGQPASPKGRKRGKRVDNGDVVSDTEADVEHSEPTHKKGKLENDRPAKGAGSTGAGVIIKGPSRGGRKSVEKNESAKKAGKKSEPEKESEEELDESTPSKRKRGRPKGSGRKDDGASGDEMAGPSSDTTPTISGKKGKPVSNEPPSLTESGKKRGRPAKPKSEEEEKSAQKKKVASPDKSAKKSAPGEKSSSPVWRSEGERGGDETLVGSNIKVWWPLDKQFYKGEIVEYDAKKKKHKILYTDGEEEVLNLAKERWEIVGKQGKTSAKKEKAATPPATLSGTKYPEPKRLKVTAKTPPAHQDESEKTPGTLKEMKSAKSVKPASAPKATKEAKSQTVGKSKVKTANAFEFDEEEVSPKIRKQKPSLTSKGGKQSKAEKAASNSKDSGSESSEEVSEEKSEEGEGVGNAEDDEPLDNWRTRSTKKSKPVSN